MALVFVRWDVTETHSAYIEIDDYDGDPSSIDPDMLADYEGDESYQNTPDRDVAEAEVIREGNAPEEEPVVVPDEDAFAALSPTDQRASYLQERDVFAEYGMEPRIVAKRGDHGDTVLITDTEGVDSALDSDEVVLVHRPKPLTPSAP